MATNTYVALDKVTVGTAVSTLTLSSISQGYTDLVLIANLLPASSARFKMQVNGDTGSNYSYTVLTGNGTAASSGRESTINNFNFYWNGIPSGWSNYTINLQNYSNTTTYKTVLMRGNSTAVETFAQACLWRSTAAITSITLFSSVGTFDVGSTFSLYGIKSQEASAYATGGMVTSDSTYWYHTFLSSGTFTPKQSLTADVLVIAGGGGGSSGGGSGGQGAGGAGGVLAFASQALSSSYSVTVGAGGAAGTQPAGTAGTSGVDSQFGALTASAGGGGGGRGAAGSSGGSGGGGGTSIQAGGAASPSGQGNAGGSAGVNSGGGGGGSGAIGSNGIAGAGGTGGAGVNTVTNWGSLAALFTATGLGVSGYIAGGGGGGSYLVAGGTGGSGGGTNGSNSGTATNAAANTGSGAGGAGNDGSSSGSGGTGGSGVVIVRYAK